MHVFAVTAVASSRASQLDRYRGLRMVAVGVEPVRALFGEAVLRPFGWLDWDAIDAMGGKIGRI